MESVLLGECIISSILSHYNKNLKLQSSVTTLGQTSVTALGQISVTAACYSSVLFGKLRKIHPRGVRACLPKRPKDAKRRERDSWPFGSSFYMFFSPPPGPALCKLGQPGVLFVLPEVLTPVLGSSFVLFSRVFPFLVFQPRHSGLLFPVLITQQYDKAL